MKLNYKQLTYIVGVLKEAKLKFYQEKRKQELALEEAKNDYYAPGAGNSRGCYLEVQ